MILLQFNRDARTLEMKKNTISGRVTFVESFWSGLPPSMETKEIIGKIVVIFFIKEAKCIF